MWLLKLTFLLLLLSASVLLAKAENSRELDNEVFTEALLLKPLADRKVLTHFHFRTTVRRLETMAATITYSLNQLSAGKSDLLVVKKKNKRYCPIYFQKEDLEKAMSMGSRSSRGPGVPPIMVDRLAAEKRAHTAELMEAMPQMLADYKKRRWERKMKEEDAAKKVLNAE